MVEAYMDIHPDRVGNMDCTDEILSILSRRVEDLANRIARLEGLDIIASQVIDIKKKGQLVS